MQQQQQQRPVSFPLLLRLVVLVATASSASAFVTRTLVNQVYGSYWTHVYGEVIDPSLRPSSHGWTLMMRTFDFLSPASFLRQTFHPLHAPGMANQLIKMLFSCF